LKRLKVVPHIVLWLLPLYVSFKSGVIQSETGVAQQIFWSHNTLVQEDLMYTATMMLPDLLLNRKNAAV
jgi:hypothetical protein